MDAFYGERWWKNYFKNRVDSLMETHATMEIHTLKRNCVGILIQIIHIVLYKYSAN